jgi:O-antigen ligase
MATNLHASGLVRSESFPRRADAATILCLFVLSLLMLPARMVLAGLPLSLTLAELLALVLGLLWLCSQMTTGLGAAKGGNPIRTAIFVYGLILVAVYGYTTYLYLPSDELNLADHSAVLFAGYVALVLVMCDGVSGYDRLDFVLKSVVVAGTFVAFVALVQFRLNLDLTTYMRLPGFRPTSVEGASAVISRSDLRRVAGTLGHPIELGALSAMLLPLAAHFGFQARDRGQPALRWWFCAALIGTGLMFSISRTAILGLAGAGLVLFVGWSFRRRLITLGVLAGFLAVMKVLVPGMLGTFYNLFSTLGSDSSIIYRTHDYPFAMREVVKSPIFGRGLGTWYPYKHQVFDNQYLLSLVESGVLGVAGFVGVIVCGICVAVRVHRLSTDPHARNLALTITAVLTVPLLGASTFDLLSFPGITSVMFLFIGAAGALLRFTRSDQADRKARSSFHVPAERSRSLIALTGSGQDSARSGSS